MREKPENECRSLIRLMQLAPEAINEIDDMLKRDLPGAIASKLNRIVADLYEISLLQDQIASHFAHPAAGHAQNPEAQSWAGCLTAQADEAHKAGPERREIRG